jgi:hypothetical protein
MLCPNKKFVGLFFAKQTVTAIVDLDMEEILMPSWEDKGPSDMLFPQDRVPPYLHRDVGNLLNQKLLDKWICRDRPISWLLVHMTLLPLIFSLGVRSIIAYDFAILWWEDKSWCNGYSYLQLP